MKRHTWFNWALAIAGALALWVANAAPAAAQQRGTIRGTVREAASQRPLAGVQVFVPGTQMSTTTDAQGRFELTGVPAGGVQVRVRAPGYTSALATTMVVAGQAVTVDFALNVSVIALDEVVVTGTGAGAERKQLGNTIATVKADMVEEAPIVNFSQALAAREAGVSILPSSGLSGEGARIRIRGNASLSQSNEPVVYIDGVRVDNGGGFTNMGTGGGGTPSRLDDINPEQIERIEILKGAAAATLYGSEASAGVIQIFTKRGSQGRPKFSFRIDQSASRFPAGRIKPNAAFPRDTAQARRVSAIMRSFMTFDDANGNGKLDPFEVFEVPLATQYYGTGYGATYSANVTGGGADATYNLAARWTKDDGPFAAVQSLGPGAADVDRKVQTSANVTMFPKERVTLSGGLMYTDAFHQTPPNNNNIYGIQSTTFNSRPFLANCNESKKLGLGGPDGEDPQRPGHCAGPGNEWGSPTFGTPREAAQREITQNAEHFNGNIKATYNPVQQVRLEGTFGLDVTNTRDAALRPFGYNIDKVTRNYTLGLKEIGSRNNRQFTLDAKATWDQRFGKFRSTMVAGTQSYITKVHSRGGDGWDFPGPGLEVASAGANQDVVEGVSQVVNLGVLGQEQIGYNDWAFVTVGGRWDRNSAFGENTSGAFYPKVSASLVVSDLPGWRSTTLSTLRLRGALGRSGLQPGAFDKFTTFGPLASEAGPGLAPANLGNPDLKPEVSRELEAGAEVGLFNNRLGFDVTRWDRRTTDALVAKQFAPTGGFTRPQLANIGTLSARGWELKFNAVVIDQRNLSINLFANAAYLWQKIEDMGGAAPIKVGGSYPRYRNFLTAGQPPGVLLGAKLKMSPEGIPWFDTNGDGQPDTRAQLATFLNTVPAGGFEAFNSPTGRGPALLDENGNGDFLDNCLGPSKPDGYCLAKSYPDWSGSFGANITVARNWQVNSLFEYKTGNYYVTNLTDAFRWSNPVIGRNLKRVAELESIFLNPASTGEQRADALIEFITKYKALSPYDGLNQTENARFLRLRELAITYTAPAAFAQKLGLSNLAFNLAGRDLLLFTPYTGIDPELNNVGRGAGSQLSQNYQDGIDAWGFPMPRRLTFSVRFGF